MTLVSLIRPKFKTGNHLIMACGRLVSGPTTSHYITQQNRMLANINIHKVLGLYFPFSKQTHNPHHTGTDTINPRRCKDVIWSVFVRPDHIVNHK